MEAEYDQMAEEYDATRDVPTVEEVDAIQRALGDSRTVLDVGIGTGRFAKPVSERGFDVTGVDVSRRMLLKAREKDLREVVLGDAYSLPFRDKSFDSCVMIHIIHVVADWRRMVREVGRVARSTVITILRVPVLPEQTYFREAPAPPTQAPAGAYPVRTQHRMWQNEQELKTAVPPATLERIRDEVVEIPIADAFRRLEAKRPFGGQMVPEEIRRQMMDRIIAMSGSQVVHRRIVEELAVWRAEQLSAL